MPHSVEATTSRTVPPARPIRLYRHALSGHCHRVELMLSLLELPFETVEIDFASAEHKQPAFLAISPFGQVPAIDDDGLLFADSNAILVYLASRYDTQGVWLPRDPVAAARVQRWLSVAAGDIAFGPAAARVAEVFKRDVDTRAMIERAALLLSRMEAHLAAPAGDLVSRRRHRDDRGRCVLRLHRARPGRQREPRPLPGRTRMACPRRRPSALRADGRLGMRPERRLSPGRTT